MTDQTTTDTLPTPEYAQMVVERFNSDHWQQHIAQRNAALKASQPRAFTGDEASCAQVVSVKHVTRSHHHSDGTEGHR